MKLGNNKHENKHYVCIDDEGDKFVISWCMVDEHGNEESNVWSYIYANSPDLVQSQANNLMTYLQKHYAHVELIDRTRK